jgi:hypothetical protein
MERMSEHPRSTFEDIESNPVPTASIRSTEAEPTSALESSQEIYDPSIERVPSLLRMIEGCSSENLTSGVLAYLLIADEHEAFQRLFFQLILDDDRLQSTCQRRYRIRTEVSVRDVGRLDLVIEGTSDDSQVFIENKLTALFTTDEHGRNDQLLRYMRGLRSRTGRGTLVLLCPARWQIRYEREAREQFEGEYGPLDSIDALNEAMHVKDGVRFVTVTWDRLLELLGTFSEVARALQNYVNDRYLVEMRFTSKELKMLLSDDIPNAIEKVRTTVDVVVERLKQQGFKVGRFGGSYWYYSYPLEKDGFRFHFGYDFPQWKKTRRHSIFSCGSTMWGRTVC